MSVLHRYDVPLAGLFESEGVTYAFACLRGEGHAVSLWLYGSINSLEAAARLESQEYDGAAAVVGEIAAELASCLIVLALAHEDAVVLHADYDASVDLDSAIADFMTNLDHLGQVRQQDAQRKQQDAEEQRVQAAFVVDNGAAIRSLLTA